MLPFSKLISEIRAIELKILVLQNEKSRQELELTQLIINKLDPVNFVQVFAKPPVVEPKRHHSEETRKRMSASHVASWQRKRAGYRKTDLTALVACLLMLFTFTVSALELAWHPSISTNVTGYKIYYGGMSGVYTNTIDVGDVTTCAVTNLDTNVRHYFVATAYGINDGTNVESIYSNEAVWPQVTSSGGGAWWFN